MRSHSFVLSAWTCLALVATATTDAHAASQLERDLAGAWQFGLTKDVRYMSVGRAFRTGVTGGLLVLGADKTMKMTYPCRDEALIKAHGDLSVGGDWEIDQQGQLLVHMRHNGEVRTEKYVARLSGDELTLEQAGKRTQKLGRFSGDPEASCGS